MGYLDLRILGFFCEGGGARVLIHTNLGVILQEMKVGSKTVLRKPQKPLFWY